MLSGHLFYSLSAGVNPFNTFPFFRFPGILLFSLKQISCPCSSPLILCIYLKNIFIDLFNLDVAGLSCSMWGRVPWPGVEPRPPALEAQTLRCWTTREGPSCSLLLHPPSDFAASLLSPDAKKEAIPLDPSLPGPSCPLPFSSKSREINHLCSLLLSRRARYCWRKWYILVYWFHWFLTSIVSLILSRNLIPSQRAFISLWRS